MAALDIAARPCNRWDRLAALGDTANDQGWLQRALISTKRSAARAAKICNNRVAACDYPTVHHRERSDVTISNETRKRLWGRSGNRCAICRQDLIRGDLGDLPGALVGEEAHIVARSPGGPRYQPQPPEICDSYENLILLCANDHTEVDAQPTRYTVDRIQIMKRRHELWVASRLQVGPSVDANGTLAVVMSSGTQIWDLMHQAMAYQCGSPENLSDEDAELIDGALQVFVDWGEISEDVIGQGFRAVRDGKRSMQGELDGLTAAGYAVLGGERQGAWGGGAVTGKIAVLQVVRASELDALRVETAI